MAYPKTLLSDVTTGLGLLGQSFGFHGMKGLVGVTHNLYLFSVWALLRQKITIIIESIKKAKRAHEKIHAANKINLHTGFL